MFIHSVHFVDLLRIPYTVELSQPATLPKDKEEDEEKERALAKMCHLFDGQ
jgi:hypothetical protein